MIDIQRKKLLTKMSKNGVQKLQTWSFLTKKVCFLKKNTNKIETDRPGDLSLGLK